MEDSANPRASAGAAPDAKPLTGMVNIDAHELLDQSSVIRPPNVGSMLKRIKAVETITEGGCMKGCAAILVVALMALPSGCASTQQMAGAELSGFFGEYASLLRPVGEDHARLLYRDPTTNWAAYRRVLLEPVTIWGDATTPLSDGQRDDLQRLADSLYQTLALKLAKDYALVDKPVSGAMRLETAIASGDGSHTEQMFVSKVIPNGQAANMLWTFASRKPPFAREVAIAFMVKDARTEDLLAAGVDRRGTGRTLIRTEAFDSWREVKDSVEYWVDASLYRLCLLRGGSRCIKPGE